MPPNKIQIAIHKDISNYVIKLCKIIMKAMKMQLCRVGWGKLPESFSQFPPSETGGNLCELHTNSLIVSLVV